MTFASGPPCFTVDAGSDVAADAVAASNVEVGVGVGGIATGFVGASVSFRRTAVVARHLLHALLLVAELCRSARLRAGNVDANDMARMDKVWT